jgi:two-component system phosphate regulon sensor histidine kinase PhoR
MKNPTPKQITLSTAGLLSLFSFIILLLIKRFYNEAINGYIVLIFPCVSFALGYFVFYYALEKFIYRKIKVIYKTIYELKSPKNNNEGRIHLQDDVIKDVEREVIRWAASKSQEIEQLEKMEAYRREFLGNVSHELKTPLFNIQGYIETLIDGGIKDDKVNMEYLHKAVKNVNRLSIIIEDLEMISLIENGTLNLEIEKFNLYELIGEVLDSLEMRADTYDIKLGFKEGCNFPYMVMADKERIRQVLINLIINSIKYGKEGGETLIGYYDMDENVLVEVSDNGIGIEKENLFRLFERFYRVDANRSSKKGGTGLGLSIVKHIIEAHNQMVNVRSTVGVGSTFGFTLKKA